jgi:hypothetical protein
LGGLLAVEQEKQEIRAHGRHQPEALHLRSSAGSHRCKGAPDNPSIGSVASTLNTYRPQFFAMLAISPEVPMFNANRETVAIE